MSALRTHHPRPLGKELVDPCGNRGARILALRRGAATEAGAEPASAHLAARAALHAATETGAKPASAHLAARAALHAATETGAEPAATHLAARAALHAATETAATHRTAVKRHLTARTAEAATALRATGERRFSMRAAERLGAMTAAPAVVRAGLAVTKAATIHRAAAERRLSVRAAKRLDAMTAAPAVVSAGLAVAGATAGTHHLCPLSHELPNPVAKGPTRTPERRAMAARPAMTAKPAALWAQPGRRPLRGLASGGTTMRADARGRLGRRARRLRLGPAGIATTLGPPAPALFATAALGPVVATTALGPVVTTAARRTSAILARAFGFRPMGQHLLDQFVRAPHDCLALFPGLGLAHLLHRPFADPGDLFPLFLAEIPAHHHAHAAGGGSPIAAAHEPAGPASAPAPAAVPVLRQHPAACQCER